MPTKDTRIVRKRKRVLDEEPAILSTGPLTDQTALFRTYFETTFEPLNDLPIPPIEVESEDESENYVTEDSGWGGFSDDEDSISLPVEIVEHLPLTETHEVSGKKLKSFMSSKPPQNPADGKGSGTSTHGPDEEDDKSETLNLKHDVDLQQIIKESQLLERSESSALSSLGRSKSSDLQTQLLGSNSSAFKQGSMPMSHRKGINAKAKNSEVIRRKEAQENGIVLEKAVQKPSNPRKRERGPDVPALGRYRGGTLTLSRSDISSIQGPKHTTKKRVGNRKR